MAVSTNRDIPRKESRPKPSRYDLVLAVIPAAFVLAALASLVSPIPLRTAMLGSSLVGAVALADGLYLNPPTSGG